MADYHQLNQCPLYLPQVPHFFPPPTVGKRSDTGYFEEPRTGDDERGPKLSEGEDLVCTSSRTCSKSVSTSSSSDDRSTELTSSECEDESGVCV